MKRGHVARAIALGCAVALACAAMAPAALADGDPASDVLLSSAAFVPSDAGASAARTAALNTLLAGLARGGFPIRVAVIPSAYDLGSVTALWRRPHVYARFLGIELSLVHPGPLLVVMPDGLGFAWPGHAAGPEYRLLAPIAISKGAGGLMTTADAALRRLATAHGVMLGAAPGPARSQPEAEPEALRITVAATAALAVVIAAGLALAPRGRLRRRLRRRRAAVVAARPSGGDRRRWPARARLPRSRGVGVAAGAGALGLLAAVAIVGVDRPWQAAPAAASNIPVGTPFTWRAGARTAPPIDLADQDGRPVTLAAFRGRPVIVTFVDPLCRNLCPLAAHLLNQIDSQLPAAHRPPIIAVSVDIWADGRSDLVQDERRWSLVPQWHWAVGSPHRLAAVWRSYQISVKVSTKDVAGTAVHFVYHDEAAYVIDASGHERALYFWPYDPQNIEHLLATLSGVAG